MQDALTFKLRLLFALSCASFSLLATINDFNLLQVQEDHRWFDVQTADLDLDGDEDFVMAGLDSQQHKHMKVVWMEAGVPATTVTYNINLLGLTIALGDLNGDSYPDIAIGTVDGQYSYDTIYNNINGQSFIYAQTLIQPNYAYEDYDPDTTHVIGIFDVDGNHHNDVVAIYEDGQTSNNKERYLRTWINQGNGQYQIGVNHVLLTPGAGQSGPTDQGMQLSHAKFDNNDSEDLLMTNQYYSALYLNNGSGSFSQSFSFNTLDKIESHCIGDVNKDGKLDLITSSVLSTNPSTNPSQVQFWPGNGDGTFGARQMLFDKNYVYKVSLGDIDQDGNLDLFLSEAYNNLRTYLGNGATGFTPFGSVLAGGFAFPGDYDGDGYLDLTVLNPQSGNNMPYNAFRYYKIELSQDAFISIPDSVLKAFLVSQYDSNSDSEISRSEAEAVSGFLDCSGLGIQDLTGIDAFTGITRLIASNNQIHFIPQLRATNLTRLILTGNQLSSVPAFDLLPNLSTLDLGFNALSYLPNLSQNRALTVLYVHNNQLTSLPNLYFLENLIHANFSNNQLTQIPWLGYSTSLSSLKMRNNQLTELPSFAGLTNLSILAADHNQLTSVPDLSDLTLLTQLDISNNQITSLSSLSNLTQLTKLIAYQNQLSTVPDLSNNTLLTTLYLQNNLLTAVPDISSNTQLSYFGIYFNLLSSDDCPEITSIEQAGQIATFIYNPLQVGNYLTCP